MHSPRRIRLLPLFLAAATLPTPSHAGTEQYWNPGATGGDGIWGTSPGDKNWNTTPGAPVANTSWPNSLDDIAVFQDGLGGIVTVFDPIDTAGIVQDGADYTINAGTITLVPDASNNAPFVRVSSGTLTIDSELAGSNGLTKNSGGDLVLSGANSYTGTTDLQSGTLVLTGSLSSNAVVVGARTIFVDQSGGLADDTDLNNRGQFTVNAVETVHTYMQRGRLDGTGSLTTTGGAFLTGGEVSGTQLGDTTSTGNNVHLSGTTGGGTLTIAGGDVGCHRNHRQSAGGRARRQPDSVR